MTAAHGGAGVLPLGGKRDAGVSGAHDVVPRGPARDLPGGAHLPRFRPSENHTLAVQLPCREIATMLGSGDAVMSRRHSMKQCAAL